MNINTIAGNGASKVLTWHGVVCARNAQEQVVGHIINAKGFEVLSAFKSNSRVGRAMPKLVCGCALGVATVGTSTVGKGIEEGKLFLQRRCQGHV